jgi:hypothetical protein
MARGVPLDAGEEIPESRCRMRNLEFLEQTAVRETDGNRVAPRADINTDTQLKSWGFDIDRSRNRVIIGDVLL